MKEENTPEKDWKEIRGYYQKYKQQWAKRNSYDKKQPEWGMITVVDGDGPAGYKLKPPYSVEEVKEYEAQLGVELPSDFKTYLTEVSRELFVAYYPMIFHLDADEPLDSEFRVPSDRQYWVFGDCLDHGRNSEECDCEEWAGGTVQVGEGGCMDEDWLVIKGTQVGSVWRVGSGGDSLHRHYESFWDYIYEPIKEQKKQITSQGSETVAMILQCLCIESGISSLTYTN